MACSSINHLFIHISWVSIHHRSILSCYLLPLPCLLNSSPPALSTFIHPNLNPPFAISIHSQTLIYPLWIYLSSPPFSRVPLPWLLIPVEGLLQQGLTRSTTSAVPVWEHTHTRRQTHTHKGSPYRMQDVKTHRHRFHSSLSNSNGPGETVQSGERENKRERAREKDWEKLQSNKGNNDAEKEKYGGTAWGTNGIKGGGNCRQYDKSKFSLVSCFSCFFS